MHENEKYPGVPERIQLMDENGKVHENPTFSSYVQDVDAEQLREAYRLMYITRRIDDEGTALQRQGQMALWAPSRGQEAAQVGSALAFAPNDYIFPSYREHAVAFARGVDFRELITVFRGSHTHGWDPKKHNFHVYTKVLAAQVPHAVGYAMGLNFDADIAAETGQLQTGQGQATNPDNDTVYLDTAAELYPATPLIRYKHLFGESFSASALAHYVAATCLRRGHIPSHLRFDSAAASLPARRILIHNHSMNKTHTLTLLSAC